jgi:hypothetical protein
MRRRNAYNFSSGPSDIVTRLTAYLIGTCPNLTTDNLLTSYPLAVSLLKDKITLLGTLKKNKKEKAPIPEESRHEFDQASYGKQSTALKSSSSHQMLLGQI